MVKVVRLEVSSLPGSIVSKTTGSELGSLLDEVRDLIESGEPGDILFLSLKEMAEEDFDNLPEFEGW